MKTTNILSEHKSLFKIDIIAKSQPEFPISSMLYEIGSKSFFCI